MAAVIKNGGRKVSLILVWIFAFNLSASADSLQFSSDSSQNKYSALLNDSTEIASDSVKGNLTQQSAWMYPIAAMVTVTTVVFLLFSLRSK